MESKLEMPKTRGSLNVLLVGNNPTELEGIITKLNQIRTTKIVIEIAFDLKSTFDRLAHFKPNYILIDDNIGKQELERAIARLETKKRTRYIPVTVIKNSNYKESTVTSDILDYLMKQGITGDSLINAVKNSLKLKRTKFLLQDTYRKRKTKLLKSVGSIK